MENLSLLKKERKDLIKSVEDLTDCYYGLEKENSLNAEYEREEVANRILDCKRKINYLDVKIYALENELTK